MIHALLNRSVSRFLVIRIYLIGIVLNFLWLMMACSSPTPSKIAVTPITPRVEITAWAAIAHGKLIQTNGCLQLRSSDFNKDYTLFWPPDFAVTIEGDNVKVISGIITGINKEVILHIGENLVLGGGTIDQLSEENQKLNPANCLGPYWVVGSIVSHGP
jgi:hypothetical protein